MELPGVKAPHDLAVVAAPMRLAGTERPVAVLVAETRESGSRLHKFILLPQGAPPDAAWRAPAALWGDSFWGGGGGGGFLVGRVCGGLCV